MDASDKSDLDKVKAWLDELRQSHLAPREWPPSDLDIAWKGDMCGMECLVMPSPFGNLNGYVHISVSHPYFGKYYDDFNVEVHGGLTFTQVTNDGQWFGFDTGHYGDLIPNMPFFSDGHLWTLDEVIEETKTLAKQLCGECSPPIQGDE
jgi:hypothetical protein